MKQEDRQLLLKDLCARLPYRVKIELTWWVMGEGTCVHTTLEPDHIEQLLNDEDGDTEIKPYLRPMSSMTEEEKEELLQISNFSSDVDDICYDSICCIERTSIDIADIANFISWLNANHFDYRGLIPMGLAIEVTEENNPYEN